MIATTAAASERLRLRILYESVHATAVATGGVATGRGFRRTVAHEPERFYADRDHLGGLGVVIVLLVMLLLRV